MSSAVTMPPSLSTEPAAAVRDPLTDRTVQVMALLLTAALALVFYEWFRRQGLYAWNHMEDWGHTALVPLISLYLLWQRRDELQRVRARVFWPGFAAIALALVAYVFFAVGVPNHMGQGLSVILAVFGATLLLTGPAVMRLAFLPIAYLVFMITLPEMIMIKLTAPLQQIAAKGSYVLLNIIGITTDLKGVVITIVPDEGKPIPLNVAEQCSGMRTLVSFVALAGAVTLVASRHWWQRIAVMICSIPVAVGVNVGRVALLGGLSLVNPKLASGEAHTFIGTLWLIPGFFAFLFIVWALNRVVRDDDAAQQAEASA